MLTDACEHAGRVLFRRPYPQGPREKDRSVQSREGVRASPGWPWCLLIVLAACGENEATPVGPVESDTVVSSIWVEPSERTIGVLGVAPFSVGAAALNENGDILYGTTRNPERFSWSSSATNIATIEKTTCRPDHPLPTARLCRLVKSESEGTATITATSQGVTGSTTVTVRDRARLAWSAPIPGGVDAGNVMGVDGTIYVGTNDFAASQTVWYAVSPQGGILWSLPLPLTGRTAPAIGEDGTLYFGSRSTDTFVGHLSAVDPGGTVRWILEDLDGIRSSPAIGPDGTIHVAGGQHVYAVNPQGDIQWTYETEERAFVWSSPAIAGDGTVYVGGADGHLHAISPDGSLRWTFRTGDAIMSSPSIGVDGTIYFGSMDGRLYAVNPDGTERWSVLLDQRGVQSSPSIGADGAVYVLGDGVVAVEPSGSIRWRYGSGEGGGATPIVGIDGSVYLTSGAFQGGVVLALDARGELLWDYPTEDSAGGSPLIGLDGMIFAAAGRELIAITETEPTNGGHEGAPWPTVRGNRANTGRAGG